MIRYLIFFCILFTLPQCGDDTVPLFEMEIEADFSIMPGLNNFETHYFYVRNVPTRIQSYLAANPGASPERILANRALLTGQFQAVDFGIVQSVSIWAVSPFDPDMKREMFFYEFVPFNHEGDLPLFSSLPNLLDILAGDRFDLEVRLVFKTFTPRELESRLYMTFNAYAIE